MATINSNKKGLTVTIERRNTDDSTGEQKTPRTARFAEATSVYSPIDAPRSPFASYPTTHYTPQAQVSDVGFGYVQPVEMEDERRYLPPPTPKGPLKSALKSPGAPPRTPGRPSMILSPTFREERDLEKQEAFTEREQANDLKVKVRVRIAKIFLRGVNFACSLIVLAMLSTALTIFHATKSIPKRNDLPPWAENTKTWPQILLLTIACISLFMSVVVILAYCRGGHHRAEKVAAYYTIFAVGIFVFSIVMWAVGAAVFNQSKANSGNKDLWGWSCVDNKRRHLFEDDVQYGLVCRLQNWGLVCAIIEIVIEVLVIIIYGIVFYRFWSKKKLRKSMAQRDRARSDLYLAQLRSQSAPNTPGFGPLSPRSGGWRPPPGHPDYIDPNATAHAEEDGKVQYAQVREIVQPQPFSLQAPPIKVTSATPKVNQEGFAPSPVSTHNDVPLPPASPAHVERHNDHVDAAPGETQYAAVPIPGAYTPLASPAYPPPAHAQQPMPHQFDMGAPAAPAPAPGVARYS